AGSGRERKEPGDSLVSQLRLGANCCLQQRKGRNRCKRREEGKENLIICPELESWFTLSPLQHKDWLAIPNSQLCSCHLLLASFHDRGRNLASWRARDLLPELRCPWRANAHPTVSMALSPQLLLR
uniref:Uncharacterized protein n=1 Tax=Dromaius novaehollandiae TaxID=8790 RepID=A0A8C4K833_DRONO